MSPLSLISLPDDVLQLHLWAPAPKRHRIYSGSESEPAPPDLDEDRFDPTSPGPSEGIPSGLKFLDPSLTLTTSRVRPHRHLLNYSTPRVRTSALASILHLRWSPRGQVPPPPQRGCVLIFKCMVLNRSDGFKLE